MQKAGVQARILLYLHEDPSYPLVFLRGAPEPASRGPDVSGQAVCGALLDPVCPVYELYEIFAFHGRGLSDETGAELK